MSDIPQAPLDPEEVPGEEDDESTTEPEGDPTHDVDETSKESFPSSDPPASWSSAGQSDDGSTGGA